MNSDVTPRGQAFANARRVLDAARQRRDRDRAAGRLAPEVELILRRLERQQRTAPPPAAERRTAA
ncbi:hypothetical protein OIU91_21190 [Streptomyces sp. NBC_01456]|uniref:hypothetical protein n=1 Tax=unclassified Streptomyces TaxID=2593676 RepID=UPI002E32D025|nr:MULTISPECIES: hypothetical protein [unclassified Streptomyces]